MQRRPQTRVVFEEAPQPPGLKALEEALNKRITQLEGRIKHLEDVLTAKGITGSEVETLRKAKKEGRTIEVHFQHSERVFRGKVLWVDQYNICIETEDEGEVIVPKHSVLYWKVLTGGGS